jgi:hypothetical protein
MTTPILPILRLQEAARSSIPLVSGSPPERPAVRLQRGPFRDRPEIWSLVPADDSSPLPQQKNLFAESDDWLAAEMGRCSAQPRVITVGLISARPGAAHSLSPDIPQIVAAIARHKIVAWLSTTGPLGPDVIETLVKNRDFVRVTVGLPTLDASLARGIDPASALPAERLELMAALVERGIPVDAALEPLLPGVTDSPDQLQALLQTLAGHGIEQVTAGYLVLHEGDAERLQSVMNSPDLAEMILASYEDGVTLRDGREMARFLAKARRQRGYATLIAQGAALGIQVRVSGLSNPDFRPAREEIPHHVRSLQQSFRERVQPVRDGGAVGA